MLSLKTVWFAHIFFYRIKIIILQKPKSSAGHASHSGPGAQDVTPAHGLGSRASQTRLFPKPGGLSRKAPPVPSRGISSSYTRIVPRPHFPSLKRSHPKKENKIQSQARPARSKTLPGGGTGPPRKYFCRIKTFIRYFKNKMLTARRRAEASSGAGAEPGGRGQGRRQVPPPQVWSHVGTGGL